MRVVGALVCAAWCCACGGAVTLEDVVPVSAEIVNHRRGDVGMIGAVGAGAGTLVIVDDAGTTFRVPVSMNGTGLGAMLQMSLLDGDLAIDLAGSDVASAADLFGAYEGSRGEIVLAFGGAFLELESEHHATMSGWLAGVGAASIWAGHQWLFVEPSGEVVEIAAP